MPLETEAFRDAKEPITMAQFDRERVRLWNGINRANNPEGRVVTMSFSVMKPDCPSDVPPMDVIESVSPDIHVLTVGSTVSGRKRFSLTVNGPNLISTVDVDSDDLALVRTMHDDFIRMFEETRIAQQALIWLVEQSKYAGMKGSERDNLLLFKY